MTAAWNLDKTTTKRIDSDYYVEGYATTFDPYVLAEDIDGTGTAIHEVIDRNAFDGCDMSDVIMQFDHAGRVLARTSNGTLGMEVDDKGLLIWADLSKTSRSRDLYEDIQAGMITKMSFRCSVDSEFDDSRMLHTITRMKHLYDVSAVSIPANDGTKLEARSMLDAVNATKEKAAKEKEKKRLSILLALEGV